MRDWRASSSGLVDDSLRPPANEHTAAFGGTSRPTPPTTTRVKKALRAVLRKTKPPPLPKPSIAMDEDVPHELESHREVRPQVRLGVGRHQRLLLVIATCRNDPSFPGGSGSRRSPPDATRS